MQTFNRKKTQTFSHYLGNNQRGSSIRYVAINEATYTTFAFYSGMEQISNTSYDTSVTDKTRNNSFTVFINLQDLGGVTGTQLNEIIYTPNDKLIQTFMTKVANNYYTGYARTNSGKM